MIHPPVANAASHKECGAACIASGVPLAIAGDDGALYFPADGNKRLAEFHGQRVPGSGTVTEKSEPMELKMPVGDKNTMTVKVEGGYKVARLSRSQKPARRSHDEKSLARNGWHESVAATLDRRRAAPTQPNENLRPLAESPRRS